MRGVIMATSVTDHGVRREGGFEKCPYGWVVYGRASRVRANEAMLNALSLPRYVNRAPPRQTPSSAAQP